MAIEHINEFDTLNAGRNKINKHAIDPANRAEINSIDAKSVANQANQTSQSAEAIAINTDDRLDNIIASEMQDAEVIDARKPFGSDAYATLGERLDESDAQLAQIEELKNNNFLSTDLESALGVTNRLEYPEGFDWDFEEVGIYKGLDGKIYTNAEVNNFLKEIQGVTYYVAIDGDDNNDGLSPESALRGVHSAMEKSDVAEIIVGGGLYSDAYAFNNILGVSPARKKDIIIRASDTKNKPIFLSGRVHEGDFWKKVSGYENVYRVSRTLVDSVYDMHVLDSDGDFQKHKEVDSVSYVDSTPGTYHYTDNELYIHTFDSRPADSDIYVQLDVRNYDVNGNYFVYFENCIFYGGNDGCISVNADSEDQNQPLLLLKNCILKYASGGSGGLTARGYDVVAFYSEASNNKTDGFNYHHSSGTSPRRIPRSIEIGCVGRKNGLERNTLTDNGSTMHDGGKIIRINGDYADNNGPNIHDINPGTKSWNLGCKSHNSVADNIDRAHNYISEAEAKMWLDNCVGYSSDGQISAWSGFIKIRSCKLIDGKSRFKPNNLTTY